MSPHRIQLDPGWTPQQLQTHAADPRVTVLQFDARMDDAALPGLAKALDSGVFRQRPDIQLRAYGFNLRPLDLSFLRQLPHLQRLCVDCTDTVAGEDAIATLEQLRQLEFDVLDSPSFGFLQQLPATLEALRLGKSGRRGPDLAVLRRYPALRLLSLNGQTHGSAHIAQLSGLQTLYLSGQPLASLPFLPALGNLQHLYLGFGAAEELRDLQQLPALRTLRLLRVRGLADLSTVARLPRLQHLYVEDQPHLQQLPAFNGPASRLGILLANVGLTSLDWAARSTALHELAMLQMKHITPAQVQALLASAHALKRLQVGLARTRDNREVEQAIHAAGLGDAPGWWQPPAQNQVE